MKIITNSIINKIYKLFLLGFLLFGFSGQAQTTVNSLSNLMRYLNDSNVNVKLSPGTYWIRGSDIDAGLYNNGTDIVGRLSKSLLLFEGNNSTYDFTGVTINVETAVFQAYGNNHQVYEVHTVGNNNVIKNLTLVDVGSVHDAPKKGANSIVMDGKNNRIEGFRVTTKGSYPYGYGDSFGKGGSNNTIPHKKHSACLIRGESNHLKNSTFIHRSYGHCIYMQAASNPTIEGCNVEGEVRTTDDMLAEEGTGSPADNIDFMTTWGYRLPRGYMMSTGEAGIRAYGAGETVINGVEYERGTSNPTILNCTVKNMRTGVTLTHASGTKTVKDCTVKGCEQGYAIGVGSVINCKADAAYGPVYQSTYNSDRNFNADITIIAPENGYYNGSKSLAYIGGRDHNITLRITDPNINPELSIQMGGDHKNIRFLNGSLANQNNHEARNIDLDNQSGYHIDLPSTSSGNQIQTCGSFTDRGSNNDVEVSSSCGPNACVENPAFIEAECYSNQSGVQSEQCSEGGLNIGWINNNDWMVYNDLDLTNAKSMNTRVACNTTGGTIELRLDSTTGTLIGSQVVSNTGGNQVWETLSTTIESVTGTQDVYLVFKGGNGYLFNINYFGFSDTILSINENETKEINTFPNPVINTLYINNGETLNFELYNSLGQLQLKNKMLSNDYKVDMSTFSSGLYFLKTFNGKTVAIQKIVKK